MVVIINTFTKEDQMLMWDKCFEDYKKNYDVDFDGNYNKVMAIKANDIKAKIIKLEKEGEKLREMLISRIANKKPNNSMKKEAMDEIKNNQIEVREANKEAKKDVPTDDDEDEDTLREILLAQIRKKTPTVKEDERTKSDEGVLELFIRKEDMDFIEKDKTEVAIKSDKCKTQIKKPELRTQQRETHSQNKVRRRSPSPRRGDYKRRRHDLEKKPELRTQSRDTRSGYYVRSRSPSPRRGDYKRRRPLETEQERRDRERRERKERDRRHKLRDDTWRSQGY